MKKTVFRMTALMAAMMMTMTTFAQSNDSISTDSMMWFNQTQELSGVVVKGRLPKTRVKGDAMRTRVAGTILEKAGTVSDALSKIPSLEAERDGGVKVLGRCDAEVYINGRRVQDMKELSRLRSDTTANPARRTFLVNLNWKFNEARSKYRGSGAGEKQKARM